MSEPSVAVVVPIYKPPSSSAEELSLRSLRRHLSGYPHVLVAPEGLDVALERFYVRTFPSDFFAGKHRYSELLVSKRFYEAFRKYTYILIYQLDCLVFSDQLTEWCDRGYDYIGAPWVHLNEAGQLEFTGVGNGGFSLRRVQSCLEVLEARDRQRSWTDPFATASRFSRSLVRYAGRGARAVLRADTGALYERSRRAVKAAAHEAVPEYQNEDLFWARASAFLPSFRIPPADLAVSFAFETQPRFCYEQNDRRLPFGCHQWQEYDNAFWKPFLVTATGEAG